MSTSLRQTKLHKKMKIAIGRSKGFQEDGETLISEKKGFRRNKNGRFNSDDGVAVAYENNKLYRKETSERRDVRFKRRDERAGERVISNDHKRKRVFADRDNGEENIVHRSSRIAFQRGKSDDFDGVEKGKGLRRERKSRENYSLDKFKSVNRTDGSGKKNGTIKLEYRKETERNSNGHEIKTLERSTKEKGFVKKKVGGDGEENDVPRRTKKRGVGIDPRDISNKRLDDGIVAIGQAEKKEEDKEKDKGVEMSMNAQFRAIQPSPSILSFVEDNFLGRRRMIELRRAGYNTELSAPLDNIPSSKSIERERIEEPVFRNKLTFFAAANVSSSFPPLDLPEIAFAGRSNVGKSSMLNALTRQWGVARTSDKPGLTQTINFFKLGAKVSLVDLPGYGFAYAKEEVKEAWEELVKEYVSTRVGLKRVCLLIDTKWGMKPRDIELIDLMERSQTKFQIVLTKTDLVFPIDVARRAMQIEESLKAKKSAVQPVMMVSSKSGAGIRTLRTVLSKIARIVKV